MDWMTFVVELTKALAWPVAVVTVVILFRKPLYGLIPGLRKLKYKDLELEFSKGVEELRQESQKALPTPEKVAPLIEEERSRYVRLAEISPRAAVLESWREVESSAIACIRRNKLAPEDMMLKGHSRIGHVLLHANLVDKEQFDVLHKLWSLRNLAAHADDFSFGIEDAKGYVESALRLASHLKSK